MIVFFILKKDAGYWKSVNELQLICTPKHVPELPDSLWFFKKNFLIIFMYMYFSHPLHIRGETENKKTTKVLNPGREGWVSLHDQGLGGQIKKTVQVTKYCLPHIHTRKLCSVSQRNT